MKTRSLSLLALTAACLVVGLLRGTQTHAQGVDQICTFETKDAHYASVTSPPEYLAIRWHTATGNVESFQWIQGGATTTTWFSYPPDHGSVTPVAYYNLLNLRITRQGYETTAAYSIKGYIAPNVQLPAATFAGIYEGTGTSWFVAQGMLTCAAPEQKKD